MLRDDEYYVYDYNYEQGLKTISKWKKFYEKYKKIDWNKNDAKIVKDNPRLVSLNNSKGRHTTTVSRLMEHLSNIYGKGKEPFPVLPWSHGYSYTHSEIYNFGKLPKKPYDDTSWSYPLKQPFKISNITFAQLIPLILQGILNQAGWTVHKKYLTQNYVLNRKYFLVRIICSDEIY